MQWSIAKDAGRSQRSCAAGRRSSRSPQTAIVLIGRLLSSPRVDENGPNARFGIAIGRQKSRLAFASRAGYTPALKKPGGGSSVELGLEPIVTCRAGHRRWRPWLLLLLVAACAVSSGCVRRRLTVRSTPPGALVYVDGQFIGATPVSTDFTYYGTRNILLIKDGFETHAVKQRFMPPWYETPPLDFINENFNPYEIRDERELHFVLEAQRIVPTGDLIGRADALRQGARQEVITPLPQPGGGQSGQIWGGGPISPPSGSSSAPMPMSSPGGASSPSPAPWTGPTQRELGVPPTQDGYILPPPGSAVLPTPGQSPAPYIFAPSHSPSASPPPASLQPAGDGGSPLAPGAWPDYGPSSRSPGPGDRGDFY